MLVYFTPRKFMKYNWWGSSRLSQPGFFYDRRTRFAPNHLTLSTQSLYTLRPDQRNFLIYWVFMKTWILMFIKKILGVILRVVGRRTCADIHKTKYKWLAWRWLPSKMRRHAPGDCCLHYRRPINRRQKLIPLISIALLLVTLRQRPLYGFYC